MSLKLSDLFPILMVLFSSMYSPTSCYEKGWLYIHADHSLILEVVNSKPSGSARPCFHPSPCSPCILLGIGQHSSGSSHGILSLSVLPRAHSLRNYLTPNFPFHKDQTYCIRICQPDFILIWLYLQGSHCEVLGAINTSTNVLGGYQSPTNLVCRWYENSDAWLAPGSTPWP